MSFLQPLLLAALPLIALPVVIHLINQRRYQTVRWGAMMFLLAANRMSRGYARIRQWLILLFRTLAIAGLIFAVARPLASGWIGTAAGGKPDTTIILLDRSPSMQQVDAASASTKLQSAVQQLASTLPTIGSTRWVLIDSATNEAHDLDSPESLLSSPLATASSASADIPAMLQTAYDYIQQNRSGRTEIWICSDQRAGDWDASGGRWDSLREAFLEMRQGVRFTSLTFPQATDRNRSIQVSGVRRQETPAGAELLVSFKVRREGGAKDSAKIELSFEIDGARSVTEIEMDGDEIDIVDHRIPLTSDQKRGWGRVSLPPDTNLADNQFYFAYDQPQPRHTVIVADDPQAVRPIQVAAQVSPELGVESTADVFTIDQLASIPWEAAGLVVWREQLPTGDDAKLVQQFVDRGGQILFMPPTAPNDNELFGVRWQGWADDGKHAVETWRGDQDLLANTQSGAALPVGELEINRHAKLKGELVPLATLSGGAPLVGRAESARGGVYFLATSAEPTASNLASAGVVMYVAVQRALAKGAAVLGASRQAPAGPRPDDLHGDWTLVAGNEDAISTEYSSQAGVYAVGDRTVAINRPEAEDGAAVVPTSRVEQLFEGLDFARIEGSVGSTGSLAQEIWRLFLTAMMIALVVEAALCLPNRTRSSATATSATAGANGFGATGFGSSGFASATRGSSETSPAANGSRTTETTATAPQGRR